LSPKGVKGRTLWPRLRPILLSFSEVEGLSAYEDRMGREQLVMTCPGLGIFRNKSAQRRVLQDVGGKPM
jgi:hypothetical protein